MMIPSLDIEVKALAERARDYGEPVEWIDTVMLKEVIGGPLVYLHGTRKDFRELAAALYALTGTGPDESDERRVGEFERKTIRDKNAGRGEVTANLTTMRPLLGAISPLEYEVPKAWWCCAAEFGEHEPTCPNYRGRGSELLDSAARSLVDGKPVLATPEEIREALEVSHGE